MKTGTTCAEFTQVAPVNNFGFISKRRIYTNFLIHASFSPGSKSTTGISIMV